MEQQIREALDRISSADWKASYEEGTNFPFMHIYGKDCVSLAEHAPQYLEWCLSQLSTLQQQNKQMKEALEYYASFGVRFENGDWDVGEHAREVLQSIQGGTDNG